MVDSVCFQAAEVFDTSDWAIPALLPHITPDEITHLVCLDFLHIVCNRRISLWSCFKSLAGENPFHIAAKSDNIAMMKVLLDSHHGKYLNLGRAGAYVRLTVEQNYQNYFRR
jgi:hypothetical protein